MQEDVACLLVPVLLDEPARRERDEDGTDGEQNGCGTLHAQWDAPLSVAAGICAAIADPVGECEADGDHHALQADNEAARGGSADFGEVDGDCSGLAMVDGGSQGGQCIPEDKIIPQAMPAMRRPAIIMPILTAAVCRTAPTVAKNAAKEIVYFRENLSAKYPTVAEPTDWPALYTDTSAPVRAELAMAGPNMYSLNVS